MKTVKIDKNWGEKNRQKVEKMVQINSFVFFDIETTGLRGIEKPKITELVFIAWSRQHLLEGKNEVPRVKSKLLLPFNPEISIHPNASRITGR